MALAGELDLSTIRRMEGPLLEQIGQRPAVMVDLSKLTFIDSSGIGTLIKACRSANGTTLAVLVGPGSQVERIFEIAGIAAALPVFSDRGKALSTLVDGRGRRNGRAGD